MVLETLTGHVAQGYALLVGETVILDGERELAPDHPEVVAALEENPNTARVTCAVTD